MTIWMTRAQTPTADLFRFLSPDGRKLAHAVLDGESGAALALADEVREKYLHPDGFVSRDDLEARVRELEARNADLERELLTRNRIARAADFPFDPRDYGDIDI